MIETGEELPPGDGGTTRVFACYECADIHNARRRSALAPADQRAACIFCGRIATLRCQPGKAIKGYGDAALTEQVLRGVRFLKLRKVYSDLGVREPRLWDWLLPWRAWRWQRETMDRLMGKYSPCDSILVEQIDGVSDYKRMLQETMDGLRRLDAALAEAMQKHPGPKPEPQPEAQPEAKVSEQAESRDTLVGSVLSVLLKGARCPECKRQREAVHVRSMTAAKVPVGASDVIQVVWSFGPCPGCRFATQTLDYAYSAAAHRAAYQFGLVRIEDVCTAVYHGNLSPFCLDTMRTGLGVSPGSVLYKKVMEGLDRG